MFLMCGHLDVDRVPALTKTTSPRAVYNLLKRIRSLCCVWVAWSWFSVLLAGQANQGELRLAVTDPAGAAVKTVVHIVSQGNEYASTLTTDADGRLVAQRLPYGDYRVEIQGSGFAPVAQLVTIDSSIARSIVICLQLRPVQQSVVVNAGDTLLERERGGIG